MIEFDVSALFKVRQSPDLSLGTKGLFMPFLHIISAPVINSRENPSNPQSHANSRIAGGREVAYNARSGAARSGAARFIRVQSNSNNYQSRLVYLLRAKTGSFYSRTGRAARFVPSVVAAASVVNPNCIIKI